MWSAEEDAALRSAVAADGRRWARIARRREFGGRSAVALRLRWLRIGSEATESFVPVDAAESQSSL